MSLNITPSVSRCQNDLFYGIYHVIDRNLSSLNCFQNEISAKVQTVGQCSQLFIVLKTTATRRILSNVARYAVDIFEEAIA
jgi:hypothetical protein